MLLFLLIPTKVSRIVSDGLDIAAKQVQSHLDFGIQVVRRNENTTRI